MAKRGSSWLDYGRGAGAAPRIKAAPKRQRRKTVVVRAHCRARGAAARVREAIPF